MIMMISPMVQAGTRSRLILRPTLIRNFDAKMAVPRISACFLSPLKQLLV
jgi:hypothetical protein